MTSNDGNNHSDLHEDEYEKAISDFSKSIELNPNEASVYIRRGVAYQAKGEYGQAIAHFTKAIEIDPDNDLAYRNRAVAYLDMRENEKAIFDLNKAIDLKDDYQNTYERGWLFACMNEHDKALADFTELIKMNPNKFDSYYSRGWAYAEKGDYARAIADFTELIKMNNDSSEAYYSRGKAYLSAGKYNNKAVADFSRAIDLGDIYSCFSRGLAYAETGKKSEAVADFLMIIRLSKDPELIPKARQEIEKLEKP